MFTLVVNGTTHQVDVEPDMPLLWVLRDILGLTGTKYGCGVGQCGACTVHVDGSAQRACLTAAKDAEGKRITTIEGLAAEGDHVVQRAWMLEGVSQCGYCQPGQIMSAAALLQKNKAPTDADIDAAMAGNLCRCGTYHNLRKAIHRAANMAPNTVLVDPWAPPAAPAPGPGTPNATPADPAKKAG